MRITFKKKAPISFGGPSTFDINVDGKRVGGLHCGGRSRADWGFSFAPDALFPGSSLYNSWSEGKSYATGGFAKDAAKAVIREKFRSGS